MFVVNASVIYGFINSSCADEYKLITWLELDCEMICISCETANPRKLPFANSSHAK